LTKYTVKKIFKLLAQTIPKSRTELNYTSPFEFLIAVILSAQATDKSVNLITPKLFAAANTPEKTVKLGTIKLKSYIKSIGLYNTKAKNIFNLSKILVNKYQSQIPTDRETLESLPGIGRKSANVFLNVIYDQPTIAVDTHVFRVCNRAKLAIGKNPLEVETKLMEITPKSFLKEAGHLLLLHGRYTCTAKKPHCQDCLINKLCEYESKT
jgi:endonuclease-3